MPSPGRTTLTNWVWSFLSREQDPGPYAVEQTVQPVIEVGPSWPLRTRAFTASRAHPGAETFDLVLSVRDIAIREHRLFYLVTYDVDVPANITTVEAVVTNRGVEVVAATIETVNGLLQQPLIGGSRRGASRDAGAIGGRPVYITTDDDAFIARITATGIAVSTVRGLVIQYPESQPIHWPWG